MHHQITLTDFELEMLFRGLAAWSGQQSRGGNVKGANATREVYNRIARDLGAIRAPLRYEEAA